MVYPEPCKEFRRRPQLFIVGIVPYQPLSTRVLIVAQVGKTAASSERHHFLIESSAEISSDRIFTRPTHYCSRCSQNICMLFCCLLCSCHHACIALRPAYPISRLHSKSRWFCICCSHWSACFAVCVLVFVVMLRAFASSFFIVRPRSWLVKSADKNYRCF